MAMDAAATSKRVPSGPPNKALRNLVIGAIMVFVVMAWGGDLFLSVLVDKHPLVFIALNSRNRNLALASPHLDAWSFYLVATIRLLASDPLFFILGRWYGDAGVRWMERKTPTYGGMLRQAEGWFSKAAYPLVALAPNNFICLFAGASGMSVPGFFAANIVGTAGRLYLIRIAADTFSEPLKGLTGWIGDHRLLVFALSAILLAYTIWSERRAAGQSELGQFAQLDEELSGAPQSSIADDNELVADAVTDPAEIQSPPSDPVVPPPP